MTYPGRCGALIVYSATNLGTASVGPWSACCDRLAGHQGAAFRGGHRLMGKPRRGRAVRSGAAMTGCVFCGIVAGIEPAEIVREWTEAIAFVPLNPVVAGHVLVIPREHVRDAVERPFVTAMTMAHAAMLASAYSASNILTSVGAAATQSVFHLHLHVVPRAVGDQLMVPWGTTGDPHAPHRCKRIDQLEADLAKLRPLDEIHTGQGDPREPIVYRRHW